MEIWKPLRNFPSYNGSTEGRIMNIRTQRILQPVESEGKMKVTLRRNNIQYTVKLHRAIAETFLGEHPGMDVRHKDGDYTNNRVDNLEWVTRSELIANAYGRGTKVAYQKIPIRIVETGRIYDSIKDCANDIPCHPSYIRDCLSGKRIHVKGLHIERA
jgi:hypothetical protein